MNLKEFLDKIAKKVVLNYEELEQFKFFKVKNRNFYFEIKPIKNPPIVPIDQLVEIDNFKNIVLKNTLQFLETGIANNVLLWGERGCGKSSLIKSVVNSIRDNRLKLIQLRKTDISVFEDVLDILTELNSFKFIIFLDDLSFKENDELFIELKSVLDGGLIENSKNIIIYATSNRRHLIEEKFINDNIIHESDAISEIISLSDRFGISLGFYLYNKEQFLKIVKKYAEIFNLKEFSEKDALNFAMKKGGFTGRTAYQFIINRLSEVKDNVQKNS